MTTEKHLLDVSKILMETFKQGSELKECTISHIFGNQELTFEFEEEYFLDLIDNSSDLEKVHNIFDTISDFGFTIALADGNDEGCRYTVYKS